MPRGQDTSSAGQAAPVCNLVHSRKGSERMCNSRHLYIAASFRGFCGFLLPCHPTRHPIYLLIQWFLSVPSFLRPLSHSSTRDTAAVLPRAPPSVFPSPLIALPSLPLSLWMGFVLVFPGQYGERASQQGPRKPMQKGRNECGALVCREG